MEDYKKEDKVVLEDYIIFEDDYSIHKELSQIKMQVSATDIIDKATRFIFAEDLVSYISSEFYGLVYSNKVKKCSKLLFSPFNETIKHAVYVIRWQINKQNCPSFEIIGKLNKSYKTLYSSFVDAILGHYSEGGLVARVFLYFCVYFSELASKCYRPDFEEVLDFAVYAIIDAFSMVNEGLYELNKFAETIVCRLDDRSVYLDSWPLWSNQINCSDDQYRISEKPCFRKGNFSQENKLEENRASLKQLQLFDKSDKCEAISNLEFAIALIEEIKQLEKYAKCVAMTYLQSSINKILENNKDNEAVKCRATLEQLKLVNKSEKCEAISKLECDLNKVMENSKENQLEEYRTALEQLKLVDKSEKYKTISNVECDNKVGKKCQQNDVEEYKTALKEIKLVDNSKELEGIKNFEFALNKNIEKLLKSDGFNEKDIEFSSSEDSSENCIDLLMEKLCLGECEKLLSASESEISGDFLQEIMSVVSFEASLISAVYLPQDNQLKPDPQDKRHSLNERGNVESTKCSRVCKSGIRDSNFMSKQLASHNFDEREDENFSQAYVRSNSTRTEQENERKFEDSSYVMEHKDVKSPNNEWKESEFEKDQLILQTSSVKSDESSITKLTADFTQLELDSMTKEPSAISDHSTLRQVVHNFIESNAETQTSVTSNAALTQQETKRKSVSSAILENKGVKFTNIESKGLEYGEGQLVSQIIEENCGKDASMQLAENLTKLDHKNINDSDYTVDYSPVMDVDDKQTVECFVIYKQEGEINKENLKVLKGDSLLFAEDLIKYIAKEFYSISYSESKFDEIRHLSSNAFNETLKYVSHFIHDETENATRMIFNFISNFEEDRADWYRKYVVAILSHYVDDGLNSDVFLYYCFHFSELALKLYKLDLPEILDFAICSILDAFCLLKDDWNDFHVAVENLFKIFKTRKDNTKNNFSCFYYSGDLKSECLNTICGLINSQTEQKRQIYFNNLLHM